MERLPRAKESQLVEQLRGVVVCVEQLDETCHGGIVRIESSNARRALVGVEIAKLLEQHPKAPLGGDVFRIHDRRAPSAKRAASHARAYCRSRFTVASDTPSVSAVSFSVRPPK